MKNKFLTIFITITIVILINIWSFNKFSPKLFPEKNIVSVEKTENILNSGDFLKEKKPEKIISKWFFLKENIILTVAHWVDNFEDEYKILLWENNFSKAELIKKDEKSDFAILKTEKNFENFWKISFWKTKEENYIFYFVNNDFERLKVRKIENWKIYAKWFFEKWDSWTIFFNNNKEIVWILSEYDLENKIWIINILDEKILEK